jgi:acetyl-CoA acetyltransferase
MGFDDVARQKYPQVERINHIHTAGNSSGIVDGAALVLVGSRKKGKALDLKPGAILLSTALDELERRDKETALITLCVGGGMGIATIIERV